MGTRNAIAIDLGRRRLRAVQGTAARSRLQVTRILVEDVPADLNIDDPLATGNWLAQCLDAARIAGGPATLSVGREHVGVKRITLPTADPAELPDMTRLAMQRELPFDAESAVIDFVTVERHETSTTVLAVAVPRKQIDYLQEVAAAARLKVTRIALRTTGAAALMNTLSDQPSTMVRVEDVGRVSDEARVAEDSGASTAQATAAATMVSAAPATLAVDVVGEGVEFCVVSEGSIRFSRAAEVPAPQDELAMADAVVTEARRTWMSYRSGEESGGIGEAVIMGDTRVAEYAAGPVGEMLKMPVRVLQDHPRIDSEGDGDLSRVWPLAGLLLEPAITSERIDFLNPRQAPDVGARSRQRRLLALAAVVVVGGAAFTLMRQDLANLGGRADSLAKQREEGLPAYARYSRDYYKVEHLKQWSAVKVDWLDHAAFLAQEAPPPERIVLDSWTGTLDFRGVTFDTTSKSPRWIAAHEATIVIEGEARDRATADAFREVLLKNPIYTASTTGADAKGGKRMPFGFTYRLRTQTASPDQTPAAAHPAPAGGVVPAANKDAPRTQARATPPAAPPTSGAPSPESVSAASDAAPPPAPAPQQ